MSSGDRFKNLMAVAGWIVALCSLSISYLSFRDKQLERAHQELQEPTFSYDVLTYSAKSLPSELLQLKQPIRHQFVIRHERGGSILDLFAEFSSLARTY
jgi:hypothetical protein